MAAVQAAYWLISGIWPLLHLRSFEAVTGPKVDGWLVRTVGLLLSAVGGVLAYSARQASTPREIPLVACSTAAALLASDVTFSLSGRISKIYLLDALANVALIGCWLSAWRAEQHRPPGRPVPGPGFG